MVQTWKHCFVIQMEDMPKPWFILDINRYKYIPFKKSSIFKSVLPCLLKTQATNLAFAKLQPRWRPCFFARKKREQNPRFLDPSCPKIQDRLQYGHDDDQQIEPGSQPWLIQTQQFRYFVMDMNGLTQRNPLIESNYDQYLCSDGSWKQKMLFVLLKHA